MALGGPLLVALAYLLGRRSVPTRTAPPPPAPPAPPAPPVKPPREPDVIWPSSPKADEITRVKLQLEQVETERASIQAQCAELAAREQSMIASGAPADALAQVREARARCESALGERRARADALRAALARLTA